jgi:hypothetical protein
MDEKGEKKGKNRGYSLINKQKIKTWTESIRSFLRYNPFQNAKIKIYSNNVLCGIIFRLYIFLMDEILFNKYQFLIINFPKRETIRGNIGQN